MSMKRIIIHDPRDYGHEQDISPRAARVLVAMLVASFAVILIYICG